MEKKDIEKLRKLVEQETPWEIIAAEQKRTLKL